MRRERILELAKHVEEVCARHAIECSTGGGGRAVRRRRGGGITLHIRIPPIRSQVTYFVALHEIGHLVGRGRSGPRLAKEASAWQWALANSIVEPTDAARRSMGRRLRSYVRWAELRQHRKHPPVIPPDGSDFWALLAELEA